MYVWYHLFDNIAHKGLFHIDGLVQDGSKSIANALELLQYCTKPSMWLL